MRRGGRAFGQGVQLFARLEAYGLSGRDADLGSSAGIASDAGLSRADTENAESAQLDPLTRSQGLFQPLKHGIDCRFSFCAGQACAFDYMVDDVLFNQSGHLANAIVFDCTTPYRTDGTAFGSFVEQRRG